MSTLLKFSCLKAFFGACLVVAALAACVPAGPQDESAAVKKAVLVPQEAGWGRHDFKAYMTQWADDAKIVLARREQTEKHDIVLDRKKIEATRRILLHGPAPAGRKMVFDQVKVKVKGDKAELRVRSALYHNPESYEMADELYLLRKTSAGWKVYLNRGWPVKSSRLGDYNADAWKKLDAAADEAVRSDERGSAAAQFLMEAYRAKQAHQLLKKVTAREDATANDWTLYGWAALTNGEVDEGLKAFRKALELDDKAAVPEYVRDKSQK